MTYLYSGPICRFNTATAYSINYSVTMKSSPVFIP